MSLPSALQSMVEDWYEEEMERLTMLGYEDVIANAIAEDNLYAKMDCTNCSIGELR